MCKSSRDRIQKDPEIIFRQVNFLSPKLQGDSLRSWKYRKYKTALADTF